MREKKFRTKSSKKNKFQTTFETVLSWKKLFFVWLNTKLPNKLITKHSIISKKNNFSSKFLEKYSITKHSEFAIPNSTKKVLSHLPWIQIQESTKKKCWQKYD